MAKSIILFMGLALIASSYADYNFKINESEDCLQAIRLTEAENGTKGYTAYRHINKIPFDDNHGFLLVLTEKTGTETKNEVYYYKVSVAVADELNGTLTVKDDKVEPFDPMNMEKTPLHKFHLRYFVASVHQNSVAPAKFTPPCVIEINGTIEVYEIPALAENINNEDGYIIIDDEHFGIWAGPDVKSWELTKTKAIALAFAGTHLKHSPHLDKTLSGLSDKFKAIVGEPSGQDTNDKVTHVDIVAATKIFDLPLNGESAVELENKDEAYTIIRENGRALFIVRKKTAFVYTSSGLTADQLVKAKNLGLSVENIGSNASFVVHMEEFGQESLELLSTSVAKEVFKLTIPQAVIDAELAAVTEAAAAA